MRGTGARPDPAPVCWGRALVTSGDKKGLSLALLRTGRVLRWEGGEGTSLRSWPGFKGHCGNLPQQKCQLQAGQWDKTQRALGVETVPGAGDTWL